MEGVTRAQHEQDFARLNTSMELLNTKFDSLLAIIHNTAPGHGPHSLCNVGDRLHPNRQSVSHPPSTATPALISPPTPLIPLSTSHQAPVMRRCIPELSRRSNEPIWKAVVRDWLLADPARGLDTPLGQWPKEWYTKKSRPEHASKYNQRRLIALEYLETCVPQVPTMYCPLTHLTFRCSGDDVKFLEYYPKSETQGIRKLLEAIRERTERRRKKHH
jgi:hypothetical protein